MQIHNNYQVSINTINFKAGKVKFFSDFDGTYLPLKQEQIFMPESNKFMTDYCKRMKHFFNKTHDSLKFHITTGRTFGEFKMVMEQLKSSGYKLHLPDTFITRNGSDEFVNYGNDIGFFKENVFPFSYNFPSSDKIYLAKQECNWDGETILKEIKRCASNYALRFVNGDSEHICKGYEHMSLYDSGKLKPDEWKSLPQEKINGLIQLKPSAHQIVDFAIGSTNDGKLKISLLFPPDYMKCAKRTRIYLDFKDSIIDYLNSNNICYNMTWRKPTERNHFRTGLTISPALGDTTLSKLYDTKLAFQDILANNDLLVVAGNGNNDIRMLNPLEYLDKDFMAECKKKSENNKDFYDKQPEEMLNDLWLMQNEPENVEIQELKEELNGNGFFDKLEALPLYSIIVKDNDFPDLLKLKNSFPENISKKFIVIDAGSLDEGIIQAVNEYATQNQTFDKEMKRAFKKFVTS